MAESNNQTAGEGAQAAAHGCFVCNVAMPFLNNCGRLTPGDHFRARGSSF